MRLASRAACLVLAGAALLLPAGASAVQQAPKANGPAFHVLVLTEGNSASGQFAVLNKAANKSDPRFDVDQVKNSANGITARHLKHYNAVVFLNTSGDALDAEEQAVFEEYFHNGGGFVGIGSAIETNPGWEFLTDIIGTRAEAKLGAQEVTNKVADRVHDASKKLPEYWKLDDTYYNFTDNVRGKSHVLTTVSDAPFDRTGDGPTINALDGGTMGADHPVTWCKDYLGGRSYYTNHGASQAAWNDPHLADELVGALTWAAGMADPVYSDCGATVIANYQQVKISGPPNLSEPIGFDQLPDGRVIQTDRRGGVHLHDPDTGTSEIIANIPVYMNSEDGLYGPGLDPNFSTNHWVYLYYSPPVADNITYSDGTTGHVNDFSAPPFQNGSAPTTAADPSVWDPWIGYFQLSRFKFVDDAPGSPAHLDLSTEQQIMRVTVNRGACCHVAGDLDWDTHGNLWFVTGDDSPAGGGNAGGFGQSIDRRFDDTQTIRVTGATGGTFTLSFGGQTTAPIAYNATSDDIDAALEAISSIGADNVRVTGNNNVSTANQTALFMGTFEEQDVAQMTGDATALTGTGTPALTINTTTEGGTYRAVFVDSRRSALNTNDLRGKLLRIRVKDADIAPAEQNTFGAAYTVPAGNLFPVGTAKTRPEIYAMGFRNPFRVQVDENDVAYISDYSPDSQTPQQFHGPAGTGRFEIVRKPANYGWPICYKSDLPYYPWNVNTQAPANPANPQPEDCSGTNPIPNNSRWNLQGGPSVEAGLPMVPPVTNPEIWYSYRDNNNSAPLGTPCFAGYGPDANTLPPAPGSTTPCPRLFPELYTGGVAPHGVARYKYDPANTNPKKFPPYYDNSVILGEFGQDTLREMKLDSNNDILKINEFMPCGAANTNNSPFMFECDNPMDMQWGSDGNFYLLTYGDGFFNINADAGMYRWDYVKGQREPVAVLTADKTDGPVPLTVNFSSEGSYDPDPGDSIHFSWNFGDGSTSVEANPSHTYTTRGRFTAVLTVTDSSGDSNSQSTIITAGNTSPTVVVNTPVHGGTFDFGDDIPFTVTASDPEDGTVNCAEIQVTFVLGHDTHGHAEGGTTGCSGVLHTDPDDVSHGGNVFGVISATYTDHGGTGGVPSLSTTTQNQIRQKHQEVEFAVNQSGTNTQNNTDGGPTPPGTPGVHRGSLSNNDWIQLNGPYNLVNITSLTFRVADGGGGGTPGDPLAAIEVHQDAVDGPTILTANLTRTGGTGNWESQTFPISMSGTHELFLVVQAVPGGRTGNNLANLNWVEFIGAGVGT